MLIENHRKNPGDFERYIAATFAPPSQRNSLADLFVHVVETISDEQLLEMLGSDIQAFSAITDRIPDAIKGGQIKALLENLSEQPRVAAHLDRHYSVLRFDSDNLILPDTTLAFIKRKGLSPFSQKYDEILSVILPISSSAAIFGTIEPGNCPSLKATNRILACCSHRAFLSRSLDAYFNGLTGRIGRDAHLITDAELRKIVASS